MQMAQWEEQLGACWVLTKVPHRVGHVEDSGDFQFSGWPAAEKHVGSIQGLGGGRKFPETQRLQFHAVSKR